MKKYTYFLSFAIFSMVLNHAIANEVTENAPKTKNEITYDLNAPALLIGDDMVTVGEIKEIYDSSPKDDEWTFEKVYPMIVNKIANERVIEDAALKAGTASLPDVKETIENQTKSIVSAYYVLKEIEKSKNDEIMQSMYKAMFQPKEEIKVRHIVLKTEDDAKDVLKKLQEGRNFEKLAKEVSIDQSATDGGDIGYITKDTLGKNFEDFTTLAFKTKKGTVGNGIAKSMVGYHVLKVEDKRELAPPPFERVKDIIEGQFAKIKQKEIVDNLMKEANVKKYDLTPATNDKK